MQSIRLSQSLSLPSAQESSLTSGVPPLPEQVQVPPKSQKSPKRPAVLQSLPPVRLPGAVARQPGSAQSAAPSQSLSAASLQVLSVAWGVPPFPVQTQAPAAPVPWQKRPEAPQARPYPDTGPATWQLVSLQSTRPSQSLSWPSEQLTSPDASGWLQTQVWVRPSQVLPVALQVAAAQSGSAQSPRPSQSLSLPSLQEASATSGVPPLPPH